MPHNLPLNGTRLWADLMEIAEIGATEKGGCNRQTLTDLDGHARALFQRWGEAVGLTLTVDRVGNMIFTRPGRDPARKPVAIGSHLDTQPTGGKFDGILGVLAGLEIMRALHESGAETAAPLVLINWTNEEGARFSPPMMGSGAAMGIFSEAEVLAKLDPEGRIFGDELRRIGWQGNADPTTLQNLGAYFELHIEQGKQLEDENLDLGIVTHALAQTWYEVTVEGTESHGGSPMAGRHDAMMGAAPLIAAIETIALTALSPTGEPALSPTGEPGRAPAGEPGRATVGCLSVHPSSRNIAPGRVWFSIDTRHADPERLQWMGTEIKSRAATIATNRGLQITVTDFWHAPMTPFAPDLAEHLRTSARTRGYRFKDMPTAIGHDAVYLARHVPSVMLFCPCHDGISHNEAESITPEWATAGLEVLADAVLAAAN